MASPPLVAWMNPLPIELAPALRARRRSLAGVAIGQVLDLGGWGDHLDAYDLGWTVDAVTMLDRSGDVRAGTGVNDPVGVTRLDAAVDELAQLGAGPFDTIVSLIRTPLVADLDRFVNTLLDVLADGGYLHLLEPVCRTGRTGRLLTFGGRIGQAAGGLYLDRDLPADLRRLGLTVTDIVRFEVPSLSAPFRPFIEARARLVSPPGSSPS